MIFAALLPQAESVSDDGYVTPPGFHIIYLPYAEDIRNVEEEPQVAKAAVPTKIDDKDLKAAKVFVKNMGIDFDSNNFENPGI